MDAHQTGATIEREHLFEWTTFMPIAAQDHARFLAQLQARIPDEFWPALFQDVHGMFGLQGGRETWAQILHHSRSNLVEWMCLLFHKYPHQVAADTLNQLMEYGQVRPADLRSSQTQRDIWCQLAVVHLNQTDDRLQPDLRQSELKLARWLVNEQAPPSFHQDNDGEDVLDYLYFYVTVPKKELIQLVFDHSSMEAINQSRHRAQDIAEGGVEGHLANGPWIAELTHAWNTKSILQRAVECPDTVGRAIKKM